jgi:hypothetical protein
MSARSKAVGVGAWAACCCELLLDRRDVVTRRELVTGARDTVAGRETCWGTWTTGCATAGTNGVVAEYCTVGATDVALTSPRSSRVASPVASRLASVWNVTLLFWIDCACSVADCPGMATTSMAPPKARALLNNIQQPFVL